MPSVGDFGVFWQVDMYFLAVLLFSWYRFLLSYKYFYMPDLSDLHSYDNPNLPARNSNSSRISSPFIKVLGVMMAVGVTASALADCGNKGPKPFDARLAMKSLSDSDADKICELVQRDTALCMSGAYPAQSSLPEQLRSVTGTTDVFSAKCVSSDQTPAMHAYSLSVGPENCSNTYTTIDGKNFSFNTFYGNCQSGLPPAVQ